MTDILVFFGALTLSIVLLVGIQIYDWYRRQPKEKRRYRDPEAEYYRMAEEVQWLREIQRDLLRKKYGL